MINPLESLDGGLLRLLRLAISRHSDTSKDRAQFEEVMDDTTASGQNALFERCEDFPQDVNYFDFLRDAWRIAEESYIPADEEQSSSQIGRQARYALIAASVLQHSRNISPRLLVALVRKGVWSNERALLYVSTRFAGWSRRQALIGLGPSCKKEHLNEVLAIWEEEISKEFYQMIEVSPTLERAVRRALETIWQSIKERNTEDLPKWNDIFPIELSKEIDETPPSELNYILTIARLQSNSAMLVPKVLARMAVVGSIDLALEELNSIWDSVSYATVANRIIPFLSKTQKQNVILSASMRVVQEPFLPHQIESWTLLLPHLSTENQIAGLPDLQEFFRNHGLVEITFQSILQIALGSAFQVDEPYMEAEALARLVPFVKPELERDLITNTLTQAELAKGKYLVQTIDLIKYRLNFSNWDQVIKIIAIIEDEWTKYWWLRFVCRSVPQEKLAGILHFIQAIDSKWNRVELLKEVLPRLKGTTVINIETISIASLAQTFRLEHDELLEVMAPFLSDDAKADSIERLLAPVYTEEFDHDEQLQSKTRKTLEIIGPFLDEQTVRRALTKLLPEYDPLRIEATYFRQLRAPLVAQLARLGHSPEVFGYLKDFKVDAVDILPELIKSAPEELLPEILTTVKSVESYRRNELYALLIDRLPKELLPDLLQMETSIGDTEQRQNLWREISRMLARLGRHEHATKVASLLPTPAEQSTLLVELIQLAPQADQPYFVEQVQETARKIEHEQTRFETLVRIASYLPLDERRSICDEIIEFTKKPHPFRSPDSTCKLLSDIAIELPPDERSALNALALAIARGQDVSEPETPVEKLKRLSSEQQELIFTLLSALEHRVSGALLRSYLIGWALQQGKEAHESLVALLTWMSGWGQVQALIETDQVAWQVLDGLPRAELLVALMPLYPPLLQSFGLDDALVAIRLLSDRHKQSMLLDQMMRYFPSHSPEQTKIFVELTQLSESRKASTKDRVDPFIELFAQGDIPRVTRSRELLQRILRWSARHLNRPFPTIEPAPPPKEKSLGFYGSVLLNMQSSRIRAYLHLIRAMPKVERDSLIDEVLELIRKEANVSARVQYIFELVPFAAEGKRLTLFQEAYQQFAEHPNLFLTANIIFALVPALSETERNQVWQELFTLGVSTDWTPFLDEAHVNELLERLPLKGMTALQSLQVVVLGVRIFQFGDFDRALRLLSNPELDESHRSWGIKKISEGLSIEQIPRVQELAQSINKPEEYWEAVESICTHLVQLGELNGARSMLDSMFSRDNPRYPFLLLDFPEMTTDPEETLREAFYAACGEVDTETRQRDLASCVLPLLEMRCSLQYLLWKDFLHFSEIRTRSEFLGDLAAVLPLATILGFEDALSEIARAVQDVGKWWT